MSLSVAGARLRSPDGRLAAGSMFSCTLCRPRFDSSMSLMILEWDSSREALTSAAAGSLLLVLLRRHFLCPALTSFTRPHFSAFPSLLAFSHSSYPVPFPSRQYSTPQTKSGFASSKMVVETIDQYLMSLFSNLPVVCSTLRLRRRAIDISLYFNIITARTHRTYSTLASHWRQVRSGE